MKDRKVFFISISVLVGGFIIWSLLFIYHSSFIINGQRYFSLFDDAMISMKYSLQLIQGHGLVWNNFGRVEGYTNPLWTVLMAPFNAFLSKQFAVLAIQLLGIIIVLASASVAVKIVKMTKFIGKGHINLHSFLVIIFIFTYYPLLYWTLMGMETGLLMLFILFAVYYLLRYVKSGEMRDGYILSFFLILSYFTRPDSLYLACIIFSGVFFLSFGKRNKELIKRFSKIVVPYIIVVILHIAWRKIYYDEFVPNTVTLKVFGLSPWFRIENGYGFIKPFVRESMILIVLAIIAIIHNPTRLKLFLFSLFFVTCLYQIVVGGDPWDYWRFLVPSMPFIFILAASTLIHLGNTLVARIPFKKRVSDVMLSLLCIILALGAVYSVNSRFLKQMWFSEGIYQVEYNEDNVLYALNLKEFTKPSAVVGVFWAGAIPYYSERDGIDFLGKSDKYIARLKPDVSGTISSSGMKSIPGHNKYDLRYTILTLHPDIIQRADWGNQTMYLDPLFKYKTVTYKGVDYLIHEKSMNIYWEKVKIKVK